MLFYRAAVDLSRSTLNYVAGLIRRHRKAIRSAWRLLNTGQPALLVLVYLREGETFDELGAGFGVSTATVWRYVEETVMLLSARSPKLIRRFWGILRALERAGIIVLARARTSPSLRSRPTDHTPVFVVRAKARTPSSRPGASCASSAAAPSRPGAWARPSPSCRTTKSPEDEKRSLKP
ncbi:MAG: family transposase [Nonomuraea muscovyensis]|nr:family transposase [Nonomuraea muscovyensis]